MAKRAVGKRSWNLPPTKKQPVPISKEFEYCATAAQLKSESEKADIVRQAKAALWDNYWKTHEPEVDDLFPAPIAYTNPPRIVCEGDPNCLEPAPF